MATSEQEVALQKLIVSLILSSLVPLLHCLILINLVEGIYPAFFNYETFFYDPPALSDFADFAGLFGIAALLAAVYAWKSAPASGFDEQREGKAYVARAFQGDVILAWDMLIAVLAGVIEEISFRFIYIQTVMIFLTLMDQVLDDMIVLWVGLTMIVYGTLVFGQELLDAYKRKEAVTADAVVNFFLMMGIGVSVILSTLFEKNILFTLIDLGRYKEITTKKKN